MAIKFEKIQTGMTLWSRGSYRNEMNRTVKAEWPVVIIKLDVGSRGAVVSYNGNAAEWWNERRLTLLYANRATKKVVMTKPWEEEWAIDRRGTNVSTKDGTVATVHGE